MTNTDSRRDQSGAVQTTCATLRPRWIGGDKFGYLYDVLVDGEVIVRRSHDPEHDACRVLLAKGVTGKLTLTNLAGMPRSSIDIEVGAEWTVIEDDKRGLLLVPYRSWPGASTVLSSQPRADETGTEGAEETNAALGKEPQSWKPVSDSSVRETDDDYPQVVLRLGNDWRIIGCRDDMQWIFQRRAGSSWRSLGYCCSKTGLRALLSRNSLAPATVDHFPEMYPDGRRAVSLQPSETAVRRTASTRRKPEPV